LPTEHGAALSSAAEKLRRARRAAPATLAAGSALPPHEQVLDAINAAIRERRLLVIQYWSAGTGETTERTVEPVLLVRARGEWYYVAWCRRSGAQRTFRVATTKTARVSDESFTVRPEMAAGLSHWEGVRSTSAYSTHSAVVWYSPVVSRWIAERDAVTPLDDGACLTAQPYIDQRWLTHELLRFGGEAVPLAPPQACAALSEALDRLRARYAEGA
jgi:predicted DNA-binding transcriptional regulator YafY